MKPAGSLHKLSVNDIKSSELHNCFISLVSNIRWVIHQKHYCQELDQIYKNLTHKKHLIDLKFKRPKPQMKLFTDSHLLKPKIRLYRVPTAFSSAIWVTLKSKATTEYGRIGRQNDSIIFSFRMSLRRLVPLKTQ